MSRSLACCIALSLVGSAAWAASPEPLPGTRPLAWEGDLSEKMMDGAHRYIERKIDESIDARQQHWDRDLSSRAAYEESVAPNRERFRKIIGVVDEREPAAMEWFGSKANPALVAETETYRVRQVRWPVLDGVFGEGLWVEPKAPPIGSIVVLPDADQTPEQIMGLAAGVAPGAQIARRLAENGYEVVVPVMIDRTSRWSGNPDIRMTDQSHREWVYRQAFHMGRHVIGYEVQKVLAAVDGFERRAGGDAKVGVVGYGEGGLVAFHTAAADPRIDAALVSGYFDSRQSVWSEPIYRNVWGLLHEFGDAEIATLIAPRGLVVEHSEVPDVTDQKGGLKTPDFQTVAAEFDRIATLTRPGFQPARLIHGPGGATVGPGSVEAMAHFARMLGDDSPMPLPDDPPTDRRESLDTAARQKRQVKVLEGHVQGLVRRSAHVRDAFFLHEVMPEMKTMRWSTEREHETYSPRRFAESAERYRRAFWEEGMGKFEEPMLPPNPRTRVVEETDEWIAYDVVLDVFPELFAWGVLVVPKDIEPGERRPVVVCQHGRNGLPESTLEAGGPYYEFAARLAERGFVTFAPHNLYRGEDRYRYLDRKANAVKASLFSFILAQHDQILRWMGTLPFVDGERIGFYGLSYGGETAVRVPAILEGYCLSICSGDFNQWTRKVAATDQPFSFMFTIEWEMPYFNLGHTFDYAEMAYLIFPRPFMVERGHDDTVAHDRWVAHEYAKVRRLYAKLGLADRTGIEYFNGGHAIRGEETFDFLHEHLDWPKP